MSAIAVGSNSKFPSYKYARWQGGVVLFTPVVNMWTVNLFQEEKKASGIISSFLWWSCAKNFVVVVVVIKWGGSRWVSVGKSYLQGDKITFKTNVIWERSEVVFLCSKCKKGCQQHAYSFLKINSNFATLQFFVVNIYPHPFNSMLLEKPRNLLTNLWEYLLILPTNDLALFYRKHVNGKTCRIFVGLT